MTAAGAGGQRSKDVRLFIKRVRDAGGEVTFTRKGNMQVKGPNGIATVASRWLTPRDKQNALATVRREAGIDARERPQASRRGRERPSEGPERGR